MPKDQWNNLPEMYRNLLDQQATLNCGVGLMSLTLAKTAYKDARLALASVNTVEGFREWVSTFSEIDFATLRYAGMTKAPNAPSPTPPAPGNRRPTATATPHKDPNDPVTIELREFSAAGVRTETYNVSGPISETLQIRPRNRLDNATDEDDLRQQLRDDIIDMLEGRPEFDEDSSECTDVAISEVTASYDDDGIDAVVDRAVDKIRRAVGTVAWQEWLGEGEEEEEDEGVEEESN